MDFLPIFNEVPLSVTLKSRVEIAAKRSLLPFVNMVIEGCTEITLSNTA